MELNPEIVPPAPEPAAPPRPGLAVASLALGVLACILSLFVMGILFGLVGLFLGLVHVVQKRGPNGMAFWGIGLSIVSVIASIGFGAYYYSFLRTTPNAAGGSGSFASWQGVAVPDFSVTTLDGKTIRVSDLKGKRVILDFWATWCGPCIMEIPHFTRLYQETSRGDLEIVGISSEDADTVKAFVKKKGVIYPVAAMSEFPAPFDEIRFIPTTFFVDRNGLIQTVTVGYHDFDQLKENALARDLAGPAKAAPAGQKRRP